MIPRHQKATSHARGRLKLPADQTRPKAGKADQEGTLPAGLNTFAALDGDAYAGSERRGGGESGWFGDSEQGGKSWRGSSEHLLQIYRKDLARLQSSEMKKLNLRAKHGDVDARAALKEIRRELAKRAHERLPDGVQEMIEANLQLVLRMVGKFRVPPDLKAEMVAAGNAALVAAVIGFEPERGNQFSTYAGTAIANELMAVLRSERVVRLTPPTVKATIDYDRAVQALSQKLLREPTLGEIAKHLDIPVREVDQLRQWGQKQTSLDEPVSAEGVETHLDCLADPRPPELDTGRDPTLAELVQQFLPPQDAELINRRFGLDGSEPATLAAMAEELGQPLEQVRLQLHQIVRRLQGALEASGHGAASFE